ncbi:arylesterase [Brevundimonas sp. TWP1-2-1b1]|uniref:arylesterase n=1 Tax=Brevundimonas sp. TWP1-2-1b1 TaxID=2804646 RepID=UPI003CEEB0DC
MSARPHGAPAERVVTLLGDSLTAGYGLKPAESLPRQLAKRLEGGTPPVRIVGAGVSGDTTADGLRRVDRDVPAQTDLCVLALGANDMMQLVPADRVKANLLAIIDRLQRRGVSVLVCGMRAPPWFGAYAWAFDAVYPEVARASGAALMPFLMEGLALHPAYVLPDRIHPNAVGVGRMADALAPHVRIALDALAAPEPR